MYWNFYYKKFYISYKFEAMDESLRLFARKIIGIVSSLAEHPHAISDRSLPICPPRNLRNEVVLTRPVALLRNIVAAEAFLIAPKTRHPGITRFPALLTMGWLSRVYTGEKGELR